MIQKLKSLESRTAETGITTPIRFTEQTLRTRASFGTRPFPAPIAFSTLLVSAQIRSAPRLRFPPSVTTSEVVHLLKPPPEWGGWIRGGDVSDVAKFGRRSWGGRVQSRGALDGRGNLELPGVRR